MKEVFIICFLIAAFRISEASKQVLSKLEAGERGLRNNIDLTSNDVSPHERDFIYKDDSDTVLLDDLSYSPYDKRLEEADYEHSVRIPHTFRHIGNRLKGMHSRFHSFRHRGTNFLRRPKSSHKRPFLSKIRDLPNDITSNFKSIKNNFHNLHSNKYYRKGSHFAHKLGGASFLNEAISKFPGKMTTFLEHHTKNSQGDMKNSGHHSGEVNNDNSIWKAMYYTASLSDKPYTEHISLMKNSPHLWNHISQICSFHGRLVPSSTHDSSGRQKSVYKLIKKSRHVQSPGSLSMKGPVQKILEECEVMWKIAYLVYELSEKVRTNATELNLYENDPSRAETVTSEREISPVYGGIYK